MKLVKILVVLVAVLFVVPFVTPVFAQNATADKPADNMQLLKEKIKADKKFIVGQNMELTESEAKGFWPVYDAYQKDMGVIDKRVSDLIKSYAEAWNAKSMNNEKAKKLTADMITIREDDVKLMKSYVPKFSKVLPAIKVARYLQIENKIRAIISYEMAAGVPLIP
jgi:hypothetical protein